MGKDNWTQCVGCNSTVYISKEEKEKVFCMDCEKDNANLNKRGPFTLVDVVKLSQKKE
jgi:hypothetical protein